MNAKSEVSSVKTKVSNFFSTYPVRTFEKHETMLQAEIAITDVFYILEGRVSQYDITPTGNEVVVNVFRSGAFFPMSTAINHTENHYFFEASSPVTVHVAPASAAVDFLRTNPDVVFDLLSRVYRGMDGVLRRMAHLMGGDAKSRLIFELLNAAYRFGEVRDDGAIFVPLKENDLARQSGLARETVNRVLQALKSLGAVSVEHGGISVQSTMQLERILGSDL
jgi:CRP-like cAMP-binding protein